MVELSEDEVAHIVRVNSDDQKLKRQILLQIRANEAAIAEKQRSRDAVARAQNEQICVLCCSAFGFFRRGVVCKDCKHRLCNDCANPSTTQCALCAEETEQCIQVKEWNIMCSYPKNAFGVVKLLTPAKTQALKWDWAQRAKVEFHVEQFLQCNLDATELCDCNVSDSAVCGQISDIVVAISKNEVVEMCQLFSALKDLLKHRLQTDSLPIIDSSCVPTDYETLLATTAVIKMVTDARSWPVDKSVTASTQTDIEATVSLAAEHIQRHKVALPPLNLRPDGEDSALEDDRESLCSTAQNWFFKGATMSPYGSLRSQCSSRVPITTQHFLRSLNSNSTDQEEHDKKSDEEAEGTCNDAADDEATAIAPPEGDCPSFVDSPENIVCSSGEIAAFRCRVIGTKPTDIYWYNSSREMADQGRHRIVETEDGSQLQIFDAQPSDTGEIVCLAVNEVSVATAIALLRVEDCDLAGEEPEMRVELDSAVVKQGQIVRLRCVVGGSPVPRVTFHHNGVPIQCSGRCLVEQLPTSGEWVLQLSNSLVTDSGQYTAVASNRFGRCTSQAVVSVLATPVHSTAPLRSAMRASSKRRTRTTSSETPETTC